MKYKAVIFDLDGTILNTLADLANAVNFALKQYGYPEHSHDAIRAMIGNGVANLIRRAAPASASDEECTEILKAFKDYYREHVNDYTRPYDGICDMLAALRENGIYVGINSNKYDAALQNLCRIHFNGLYDFAAGESEATPKKPDPTAALRIMDAADAKPEETIYIGDSRVDIDTAANAGMDSAWVSWGFRSIADLGSCSIGYTFSSVAELKSFLLK